MSTIHECCPLCTFCLFSQQRSFPWKQTIHLLAHPTGLVTSHIHNQRDCHIQIFPAHLRLQYNARNALVALGLCPIYWEHLVCGSWLPGCGEPLFQIRAMPQAVLTRASIGLRHRPVFMALVPFVPFYCHCHWSRQTKHLSWARPYPHYHYACCDLPGMAWASVAPV